MENSNNIIYEIFTEENLEETIVCVVEVFCNSEPLISGLGISKSEFYKEVEMDCKAALAEGLSWIAKAPDTDQVVGFIIAKDFMNYYPSPANLSEEMQAVSEALTCLQNQYMNTRKLDKGQMLHSMLAGVNENYRNRGIARTLMTETLKKAQQQKFVGAVCEVTGIIAYQGALKTGFKEVVSIEYKDYTYQGAKVLEKIEGKYALMEKIFEKPDDQI